MNANMWQQPVVQENCRRLDERGWQRIGPATGRLACGTSGPGRMSEPDDIVRALRAHLSRSTRLSGRRILILSGPTQEAIDPVRFISNHSSGLMGQALASAADQAGAAVDFVTGPVAEQNLPHGPQTAVHRVRSAAEMLTTAQALFKDADAAVFVAAVADYTPVAPGSSKRPKQQQNWALELQPTPDIAATLSAERRPTQICLGFALETHDGPAKARAKLKRKQLDAIVLNTPKSFGSSRGEFRYLPVTGQEEDWGEADKATCAARIIERLAALFDQGKTAIIDP
jgi:phosphopantothenoylcysteine decarboxylase/phosphopantothenate--cysteine ligase